MFQAMRSPHLQAELPPRGSMSTDYSETASFISSAPSNASSVVGEFFVLCLHDYEPTDQDQLGFRKGDILAILKTEDTGWWAAAMGNTIGWVPRGYVEPITDAMADTLKAVRRDLRASVELWDSNHPRGSASSLRSSFAFGSPDMSVVGDNESWDRRSFSSFYFNDGGAEAGPSSSASSFRSIYQNPPATHPYFQQNQDGYASEATVQSHSSSPTPSNSRGHSSSSSSLPRTRPVAMAGASESRLSHVLQTNPSASPPLPIPSLADIPSSPRRGLLLSPGRKLGKNKSLPPTEDEQAFLNAKSALAVLPPYLKPDYGDTHLRIDDDGSVKSGTLEALVERLTIDPLKRSHEQQYRRTFLMTYKSLTDSKTLFKLLVARYEMRHPQGLTDEQVEEWKDRKLRPTQARVLSTLQDWVESYRLIKDEPYVAGIVIDFLKSIQSPHKNQLTAKLLLQTIEKHLTAPVSPPAPMNVASTGKNKSSKSKPHKNDILKIDTLELAQHLTLIEWRLYSKIRSHECMMWPKTQSGREVENLLRFCGTSDKLAAWVKYTVLSTSNLGRRADIIEHWIRVAEKCRAMNNVSSMSALVAALASTVIVRLNLTWAHVGRASHMEPLTKLTDPRGNFTAYRTFYGQVDTSCVPFIGIYLTNLIHIHEQYKETVHVPYTPQASQGSSPASPTPSTLSRSPASSLDQSTPSQNSLYQHYQGPMVQHINFVRLQKSAEVINQMLRHQSKPYLQTNPPQVSGEKVYPVTPTHATSSIGLGVENPAVMSYVETMLATGGLGHNPPPDIPLATPGTGLAAAHVGAADSYYWQKSTELHALEVETSDIRKGLEAAGF